MTASESRQTSFRLQNKELVLFFGGMSASARQEGFGGHVAAVGLARFGRRIYSGHPNEHEQFDERGAPGIPTHGCR